MPFHTPQASINISILLVDDNKNGLAVRKAVLQELGHSVTTAKRGAEALEAFAEAHFDMLITDYRMPKMDGIELIRHIREQAPQLPIILVSGFVEAMGLTEEATGADAVIQKNAHEVGNLTRAVNRLLRKKPATRATGAKTRRKNTGR